jgi:hypothetical protein
MHHHNYSTSLILFIHLRYLSHLVCTPFTAFIVDIHLFLLTTFALFRDSNPRVSSVGLSNFLVSYHYVQCPGQVNTLHCRHLTNVISEGSVGCQQESV